MAFSRLGRVYIIFFAFYYIIYAINHVPFALRPLLTSGPGVCQAIPFFGLAHDASHGSINPSHHLTCNIGPLSFQYLTGASLTLLRHRHTIAKHIYTNVICADPDLLHEMCGDWRRLAEQQEQSKEYRWQHLSLLPMYGILEFQAPWQDLVQVFYLLVRRPLRSNPINTADYLRMISTKCFWSFCRIVMPYGILQVVSGVQLVWLGVVTEFASDYWMAFILQVSHAAEDGNFLFSDVAKARRGGFAPFIDDRWAHFQVEITGDCAHDSWMTICFSDALRSSHSF